MNANRTRYLLASQKVRRVDDPKPLDKLPALTREQRAELYKPRPATAPPHLEAPAYIRVMKGTGKVLGATTLFFSYFIGALVWGESRKASKS